MKPTIRRGTPADLAAVQRLNHELFKYEHDQGFYAGDSYNLNWPFEAAGTTYFQDALTDSPTTAVFVAEADGRLVGYLAAGYTTRAYRTQNPIGELENMFVAAEFRGRGVGTQLVAAFLEWARAAGVAHVRVGAFAQNHPAIGFYHRQGFQDDQVYLEQPLRPSR